MATLTTQQLAHTGLLATYSAANGGGDQVLATDGTFLHVKNGSGAPITVTVDTPGTVDGLAIADPDTVIAAGTEQFIGPIDRDLIY